MPDTPETILAFDFGKRRIGVAVGQQVTSSASPLSVVGNGRSGPCWEEITTLIEDWRPNRLIVGMPAHVDGSPTDLSLAVNEFIGNLNQFQLPVESVDERYSSLEATERLKSQRGKALKRRITKEMIDSNSAVQIAERWLKKEL